MKNTQKLQTRNSILLVLTSVIWGVAFVAQRTGGDKIGPYTFNCIRNLIGAAALLPVIRFVDKVNPSDSRPMSGEEWKKLWQAGALCGAALFVASTLQQVGIYLGVSAGKAGFLTACYILLVPILGLFIGKKCGLNIWAGVVLVLGGLYLLCLAGQTGLADVPGGGVAGLQLPDGLELLAALSFAVQILLIDHFAPKMDKVRLACIQFFCCGVIGIPFMVILEMHPLQGAETLLAWGAGFASPEAWVTLLYAALFSTAVAYTLQIVGQAGLHPTVASLLMSMEALFSVIAGFLILHEKMTGRELLGCLLIFGGVIFAQIPIGKRKSSLL